MNPVHPLFKPLLAVIAGKEGGDNPPPEVWHFKAKIAAESADKRVVVFELDMTVEAENVDHACRIVAEEFMREANERLGAPVTSMDLLYRNLTREI